MELALSLEFLHRPALPAAVETSSASVSSSVGKPWLLVLMHGVGSNEADLFGLAPAVPARFHVLSLRAPNVMGHGSYAWFQFGVRPNGERVIDEAQETASRAQVAQAVQSAALQLSVPAERVVVGGFSQGGIMSLSLLLSRPELLQAAMVMHSRLLPQVLPFAAPAKALEGKNLWVSHGTQDAVIPLASAHAIREHVARLPIELSYAEFPGAHEIRPEELRQAMAWLDGLSAERAA